MVAGGFDYAKMGAIRSEVPNFQLGIIFPPGGVIRTAHYCELKAN